MADLTRDELLVLLIEECAEVIQAATKCLRFGYDRDEPGYGINSDVLAGEIGDVLGVVVALSPDPAAVEFTKSRKIAKATAAKRDRENPHA
jgi:NTP pyrophosphatase (non-canonical NTP hydrolase)